MVRSEPDQERRRTTSEKAGQSYYNNDRSDTRPPPRAERRNRDHRKSSKRNRRGDVGSPESSLSDDDNEGHNRGRGVSPQPQPSFQGDQHVNHSMPGDLSLQYQQLSGPPSPRGKLGHPSQQRGLHERPEQPDAQGGSRLQMSPSGHKVKTSESPHVVLTSERNTKCETDILRWDFCGFECD